MDNTPIHRAKILQPLMKELNAFFPSHIHELLIRSSGGIGPGACIKPLGACTDHLVQSPMHLSAYTNAPWCMHQVLFSPLIFTWSEGFHSSLLVQFFALEL